jgi:hypothetical protein
MYLQDPRLAGDCRQMTLSLSSTFIMPDLIFAPDLLRSHKVRKF